MPAKEMGDAAPARHFMTIVRAASIGPGLREGVGLSCISAHDPQLARLASAIAQRVGPQRFHVWFDNSTRLDLKQDGLEIAVPNDFISEWIGKNFTLPIQEAAHEVLGCSLAVRFSVVPQLFSAAGAGSEPMNRQSDAAPRAALPKARFESPGDCGAADAATLTPRPIKRAFHPRMDLRPVAPADQAPPLSYRPVNSQADSQVDSSVEIAKAVPICPPRTRR